MDGLASTLESRFGLEENSIEELPTPKDGVGDGLDGSGKLARISALASATGPDTLRERLRSGLEGAKHNFMRDSDLASTILKLIYEENHGSHIMAGRCMRALQEKE